jgi:hypothetical protein
MIEECMLYQSQYFGIRPIAYSITSNSVLQMLETNPEFVQTLTDAEVAYRWLMLCPTCRKFASELNEPSQMDIQRLCDDSKKILSLRSRLSSISWWMRLMNQRIAQWFNRIDQLSGVFWAGRFRSIRIVDNTALLAGLVHIDVSAVCNNNATSLSGSEFTSIVRRFAEERSASSSASSTTPSTISPTRHLAPIQKISSSAEASLESAFSKPAAEKSAVDNFPVSADRRFRCSDEGVLDITLAEYLSLVKSSCNALLGLEKMNLQAHAAAKLLQPNLTSESWMILVRSFGKAFSHVAGEIKNIEACRTKITRRRFFIRPLARMLFAECSVMV